MKRKTKFQIAMGILVLFLLIPFSHRKISSPFVVEPLQRVEIRSQTDGFIDQVSVHDNQNVEPGQVVAKLRNPELAESGNRIQSRLDLVDREMSTAASVADNYEYEAKSRMKRQLLEEKTKIGNELQKLTLKTPIHGMIATQLIQEKKGTFLPKGDLFCEIYNLDQVKTRIPVSEYDIDDVKIGQRVLLKLTAFPAQTFEGTVQTISPAVNEKVETVEATFGTVNVDVVVNNADRRLIPGMQGEVKILTGRFSFARRIGRELFRGIRALIW